MPSQWGRDKVCPHGCGLTYRKLQTGLRYHDVFVMLMDYSADPTDWKYKRRGTILGKWHEIKKSMWDYHCDEGGCLHDPRNIAARALEEVQHESAIQLDDAVPF